MIKIENLSINLAEFSLKDISLSIARGEYFALLGPTGAGKTVLLEAMVGLVPVESGKILVDGRDVSDLAPEKRGIGIVYQDSCLFPHMTVLENIRYGLHFKKIDGNETKNRLNRLLNQLELNQLTKRMTINLSGGELQRVALARALMVNPAVLLLDEPLSALDPNFRGEIQSLLHKLHQDTDTTFLMVTHDFNEVLSLAGRAAVMNHGSIEQVGDVSEIFQKPRSSFVADFVGMKNIFPVNYQGTSARLGNIELELGRNGKDSEGYLAIRPEDIVISKEKLSSSIRNSFKGIVLKILKQGFHYEITLKAGGIIFTALVTKSALFELGLKEGKPAYLSFKATAIHTF